MNTLLRVPPPPSLAALSPRALAESARRMLDVSARYFAMPAPERKDARP